MDVQEEVADVLVFCALAEEAHLFRQTASRVVNLEFHNTPGDGYQGYRAQLPNEHGEPLSLVVTWALKMSGIHTASALPGWLQRLKPAFVGMVGLCAGNPNRTSLGDLVIASPAYQADAGKLTIEEGQIELRWEHQVESLKTGTAHRVQDPELHISWQAQWLQQLQNNLQIDKPTSKRTLREWLLHRLAADPTTPISEAEWKGTARQRKTIVHELKDSTSYFIQKTGGQPFLTRQEKLTAAAMRWIHNLPSSPVEDSDQPHVHVQPMASAINVQGQDFFSKVKAIDRNTHAVDMESYAFYHTVRTETEQSAWPVKTEFLLVKGVCDFADPDKDDSYRVYAGMAASSFLLHYIRQYVRPVKRSAASGDGKAERVYVLGRDAQYPAFEMIRTDEGETLDEIARKLY